MNDKELIGQRIKFLRVNAGKSQEELGRVLNLSHAAISDLERGKTELSVRNLKIIANFFNVKESEIIEETNEISIKSSFIQSRGSFGTDKNELNEIKKAQNKFRDYVRSKKKK